MSARIDNVARRFVDGTIARYGAVGALSRVRIMAHEYRRQRPRWLSRSILLIEQEAARAICRKWVARCGFGFHPDTRGDDYAPAFSAAEIIEYNTDMRLLFALPLDPYAYAIEAMEQYEEQSK